MSRSPPPAAGQGSDDLAIWSDRLQMLFDYWASKRGTAEAPGRRDLDPLDIPRLLPIVVLVDVEHDPLRFCYRLAGTELIQKAGAEITGKTFDQIHRGPQRDAVFADYQAAAVTCEPVVALHEYVNEFGSYWRYERLFLPLIDSSGVVNMLFGGIDTQLPTTNPWKTRMFSHPIKAKR
jgi:hypothetical protein